ncbi:MAG: GntR family transcriptional regulator [Chloroflexi bacterium]|nr:GntR family transcriptional regulator [Chloroflexota bacterium]
MTHSTSDTLAQSVASALRQAIQDGVYTCGDRLVELAISQEMSVSQNTARDAIYILEREGWAQKRARHGSFVRTFTRDEAEEVYALWAAVSALALSWALENIHRARLMQNLQPVVTQAHSVADAGHGHSVLAAIFNFHQVLASVIDRIGGRPQTAELLMRLRNQARLLELLREKQAPRTLEQWQALVAAYETLLGIIKFGDSYAAKSAIRQRIEADGAALLAVCYR